MAPDDPGPGSDDFNPTKHVWDGKVWWSLDRGRWWDGSRWQRADKSDYRAWLAWVTRNLGRHGQLANIAAQAATDAALEGRGFNDAAEAARVAWAVAEKAHGPGFADRQVANGMRHRVTTGAAHAFVLALLGLPFIVFSNCAGSTEVSGYQVLTGFDFPSSEWVSEAFALANPGYAPHFGPNPALAILVAAVLVGVLAAIWGGRRGALVRVGTAAVGIGMVFAAVASMPSRFDIDVETLQVSGGLGTLAIPLVLAVSIVVDAQALVRGWLERKRLSREPAP